MLTVAETTTTTADGRSITFRAWTGDDGVSRMRVVARLGMWLAADTRVVPPDADPDAIRKELTDHVNNLFDRFYTAAQ